MQDRNPNAKGKTRRRRGGLSTKVKIPEDYLWKILGVYASENSHFLTDSDSSHLMGIIRNRDSSRYLQLSEAWSPHSTAPAGYRKESFFTKYQVAALMRKFPFAGDQKIRTDEALRGFLMSEVSCATFNANGRSNVESFDPPPAMLEAVPLMRKFIEKVLTDDVPVMGILDEARHGPGASLGISKGNVSKYFKYSEIPYTVTRSALPYARFLIREDERWFTSLQLEYIQRKGLPLCVNVTESQIFSWCFRIVEGNEITFVPKDSRKDRPIAIEPTLNLMLQLGVDGFVRRRLKRFGCDLDSQEKNQFFAKLGSEGEDSRKFCTIDLSAASDSVSTELCRLLLPHLWYTYLMDLRSPTGVVRGRNIPVKYEKISSMGNGYTFALESLLFLAAAYAAMKISNPQHHVFHDVAVYGDDIVIPRDSALLAVEILSHMGFTVNTEKSFFFGPFRESCGCDYFEGTFCRPLYIKEGVTNVKQLWTILNRLSLLDYTLETEGHPIGRFSGVIDLLQRWVPPNFKKFVGPPSTDEFDTYLHLPISRARELKLASSRGGQYTFRKIITVARKQAGPSFHFRKLMHSLRSVDILEPYYLGSSISGGSVFDVTRRGSLFHRVAKSQTSFWFEDYRHVLKPVVCLG